MPLDIFGLHKPHPTAQLPLLLKGSADQELVIDNFAGGGGASDGIEQALGRPVDVAINHDPDAISVHLANHPRTIHLCESVWEVNPKEITDGRRISLVWLSPDCKHFSKAKGSKPVEKKIRGLAWVALRWASLEALSKPRVLMLENVEEFKDWGPLLLKEVRKLEKDGTETVTHEWRPDPDRKGQTFNSFVNALRRQGYQVEWRELRGSFYGAPTIRKRLFLIARCDGLPIVWPAPTHGDPESEDVKSGKLLPFRTAAECIDFSKECPSIFLTPDEAKAYGVRRPLADATMARIMHGVKRYVLESPNPFLVNIPKGKGKRKALKNGAACISRICQTGGGHKVWDARKPVSTITSKNEHLLIHAEVAAVNAVTLNHQGGFRGQSLEQPFATITAARDAHGVMAAHLTKFNENSIGQRPDEPDHTVMAGATRFGLVGTQVVPYMVSRYGERAGQESLTRSVQAPGPVVVPTGNDGSLVAVHVEQHNTRSIGQAVDTPITAITAKEKHALVTTEVAAFQTHFYSSNRTASQGELREPAPAVTAQGFHHGIVAAHIVQQNTGLIGHDQRKPISTIVGRGSTQNQAETLLVPPHYLTDEDRYKAWWVCRSYEFYVDDEAMAPIIPGPRASFLTKGGLVVTDIGLRMFDPEELMQMQGFRKDYIIDRGYDGKRMPKDVQCRLVGNSVCPQMSYALVKANIVDLPVPANTDWPYPSGFAVAAECP